MTTVIQIELDGRVHGIPLREFKKAETRADRATSRPTDSLYNGKSYNSNMRCAIREFLTGKLK